MADAVNSSDLSIVMATHNVSAVIDRDVLTCPAKDVAKTKVLYTIVGGKVVYEGRE